MTFLKVDAQGSGNVGQLWQNTYYFESDVPVTGADAADLTTMAREYLERIYNHMVTEIKSGVQAVEFFISIIDAVTGLQELVATSAWTFVGTDAAQGLPGHNSAFVRKTAIGLPHGKRVFLHGLTEDASFNGALQAPILAALVNFVAEMSVAPPVTGGITLTPKAYSKKNNTMHSFGATSIVIDNVRPTVKRAQGRGA